ncbi:SRPBCC domain-containing protein [Streptomyces sp. NPDC059477]|uniref:SRPBCC family protein n=1 Tax=Streptomyces sp. NPDC059477 TaxID=3346847 RepID=UPI0036C2510E
MSVRVRLLAQDGGTRLETRSHFDSREQLEQLITMGLEEGLTAAAGQMDALPAE